MQKRCRNDAETIESIEQSEQCGDCAACEVTALAGKLPGDSDVLKKTQAPIQDFLKDMFAGLFWISFDLSATNESPRDDGMVFFLSFLDDLDALHTMLYGFLSKLQLFYRFLHGFFMSVLQDITALLPAAAVQGIERRRKQEHFHAQIADSRLCPLMQNSQRLWKDGKSTLFFLATFYVFLLFLHSRSSRGDKAAKRSRTPLISVASTN